MALLSVIQRWNSKRGERLQVDTGTSKRPEQVPQVCWRPTRHICSPITSSTSVDALGRNATFPITSFPLPRNPPKSQTSPTRLPTFQSQAMLLETGVSRCDTNCSGFGLIAPLPGHAHAGSDSAPGR